MIKIYPTHLFCSYSEQNRRSGYCILENRDLGFSFHAPKIGVIDAARTSDVKVTGLQQWQVAYGLDSSRTARSADCYSLTD